MFSCVKNCVKLQFLGSCHYIDIISYLYSINGRSAASICCKTPQTDIEHFLLGPAEVLYQNAYFNSIKEALKPGGIMCMQGGCG